MNRKQSILFIAGLILSSLIAISGCTNSQVNIQTNKDVEGITPTQALCDALATRLDRQIVDTQNPPGRLIISNLGEDVGEVGGTLTSIKSNGLDREYTSYTLTFKGKEPKSKQEAFLMQVNLSSKFEGELYLLTTSNETLPYEIGKFYAFDLKNINMFSAATSGMFIDDELNKLTVVDCEAP